MLRHWLLTSTTYGTWLPGDVRGFVSPVGVAHERWVLHNVPGTPYDEDIPERRELARGLLKGQAVLLDQSQARVVVDQFIETATYRNWQLHAIAVMANHFHVVASAAEEVQSTALLRDLKGCAARSLNKRYGKPASGTWWTQSGSRRPLPNEQALRNAIEYVLTGQKDPLVLWPQPERGE